MHQAVNILIQNRGWQMDGFMVDIAREDWEKLPQTQQSWLVYCAIQNLNRRVKLLENHKHFDKALSFLGGVLGGITAIFAGKMKP